ncbi:hypothetical protein OTU49_015893 [Cherax quadricarinatus]|uniref:Uncharacterized protein n=1 Tax=Cherax quadricarinatus TaxID=27406 RepID=A0AAW0XVP0_CHEQU
MALCGSVMRPTVCTLEETIRLCGGASLRSPSGTLGSVREVQWFLECGEALFQCFIGTLSIGDPNFGTLSVDPHFGTLVVCCKRLEEPMSVVVKQCVAVRGWRWWWWW